MKRMKTILTTIAILVGALYMALFASTFHIWTAYSGTLGSCEARNVPAHELFDIYPQATRHIDDAAHVIRFSHDWRSGLSTEGSTIVHTRLPADRFDAAPAERDDLVPYDGPRQIDFGLTVKVEGKGYFRQNRRDSSIDWEVFIPATRERHAEISAW